MNVFFRIARIIAPKIVQILIFTTASVIYPLSPSVEFQPLIPQDRSFIEQRVLSHLLQRQFPNQIDWTLSSGYFTARVKNSQDGWKKNTQYQEHNLQIEGSNLSYQSFSSSFSRKKIISGEYFFPLYSALYISTGFFYAQESNLFWQEDPYGLVEADIKENSNTDAILRILYSPTTQFSLALERKAFRQLLHSETRENKSYAGAGVNRIYLALRLANSILSADTVLQDKGSYSFTIQNSFVLSSRFRLAFAYTLPEDDKSISFHYRFYRFTIAYSFQWQSSLDQSHYIRLDSHWGQLVPYYVHHTSNPRFEEYVAKRVLEKSTLNPSSSEKCDFRYRRPKSEHRSFKPYPKKKKYKKGKIKTRRGNSKAKAKKARVLSVSLLNRYGIEPARSLKIFRLWSKGKSKEYIIKELSCSEHESYIIKKFM